MADRVRGRDCEVGLPGVAVRACSILSTMKDPLDDLAVDDSVRAGMPPNAGALASRTDEHGECLAAR
jgi:hypothetical protein